MEYQAGKIYDNGVIYDLSRERIRLLNMVTNAVPYTLKTQLVFVIEKDGAEAAINFVRKSPLYYSYFEVVWLDYVRNLSKDLTAMLFLLI